MKPRKITDALLEAACDYTDSFLKHAAAHPGQYTEDERISMAFVVGARWGDIATSDKEKKKLLRGPKLLKEVQK